MFGQGIVLLRFPPKIARVLPSEPAASTYGSFGQARWETVPIDGSFLFTVSYGSTNDYLDNHLLLSQISLAHWHHDNLPLVDATWIC